MRFFHSLQMVLFLNHYFPVCMMQLLTPEIKKPQLASGAGWGFGEASSWGGGWCLACCRLVWGQVHAKLVLCLSLYWSGAQAARVGNAQACYSHKMFSSPVFVFFLLLATLLPRQKMQSDAGGLPLSFIFPRSLSALILASRLVVYCQQ